MQLLTVGTAIGPLIALDLFKKWPCQQMNEYQRRADNDKVARKKISQHYNIPFGHGKYCILEHVGQPNSHHLNAYIHRHACKNI
jgi:hypothetical protein